MVTTLFAMVNLALIDLRPSPLKKKDHNHFFLPTKHKFCVRERNVSTFLFRTQNICSFRHLLKYIKNRSYSLSPVCPKFISK